MLWYCEAPLSSATLLPLCTNLSGCACAWLNGSSESWSRDTSHTDRVAPLQNKQQRSYWNTADCQTWLPSHTGEAGKDPHTIHESMLSLSKGTVRSKCPSQTTATCHAFWLRVGKGEDMTEAHPNVHLGPTVTSAKRLSGHTTSGSLKPPDLTSLQHLLPTFRRCTKDPVRNKVCSCFA